MLRRERADARQVGADERHLVPLGERHHHVREVGVVQRLERLAQLVRAVHRHHDEPLHPEPLETPDLLLLLVEPVGARGEQQSVAGGVGPLLRGVGDEREERRAEIPQHEAEHPVGALRRGNGRGGGGSGRGVGGRRPHDHERPAPDSAMQHPLRDEAGERLVDRDDRDAVRAGELAVRLDAGADGHGAGDDLSADVGGDLLVERGGSSGIDAHVGGAVGVRSSVVRRAARISYSACTKYSDRIRPGRRAPGVSPT
jgi:hypothetical protein